MIMCLIMILWLDKSLPLILKCVVAYLHLRFDNDIMCLIMCLIMILWLDKSLPLILKCVIAYLHLRFLFKIKIYVDCCLFYMVYMDDNDIWHTIFDASEIPQFVVISKLLDSMSISQNK